MIEKIMKCLLYSGLPFYFVPCLAAIPGDGMGEIVEDASWIVVGRFELQEESRTEVRVQRGDYEWQGTLIHGILHADFISREHSREYERRLRYGVRLPDQFNVVVFPYQLNRIPLSDRSVWMLRPNASLSPYHATWMDPDRYSVFVESINYLAKESERAPDFEREYHEKAVLTAEEEYAVVTLAKRYGLTDVAKIRTQDTYVINRFGIAVQERETISGRRVRYRVMHTKYRGEGLGPEAQYESFSEKSFIRFVEKTILRVEGKEHRAQVFGVPIEDCERILSLIWKEEFFLGEKVNENALDGANLKEPFLFTFEEERALYKIGFSHVRDPYMWFYVLLELNDDRVRIVDVRREAA